MKMITLRAPQGATGLSFPGEDEFKVRDGVISIPEIYKSVAESHGYGKAAERVNLDRLAVEAVNHLSVEQIATMGRGDLLIYCTENCIDVPPKTGLDDLRKLVHAEVANKQRLVAAAKGK